MLSLNLGVRNLFLSEEKVRVSLEFTCIQLCPPSPHQRKALISFGTGCWSYRGSPRSLPAEWGQVQKTLLFLMFLSGNTTTLCLQKAAQALEGNWMRQAHAQAQQTRATEHARATMKSAQLSTSMVGQCYISMELNNEINRKNQGRMQGNACFVSESHASMQKWNKRVEVKRELG